MNPGNRDADGFDHRMRQLHATALEQVSPTVRARLRASRHAATSAHAQPAAWHGRWPWLAGSVASAVLAVAIGVQWLPGDNPAAADDAMLAASEPTELQQPHPDSLALLDEAALDEAALDEATLVESPEFYLWLASAEAVPFAME